MLCSSVSLEIAGEMSTDCKPDKVIDVIKCIAERPDACELKWSLFYSAVASGNPSVIKPYPPSFLDKANIDIHLEELQCIARQVPAFKDLPITAANLPEEVIDLLHWVLIQSKEPRLLRCLAANYPAHLKDALSGKPTIQWPQYVFEVLPNTESNTEKRFQEHKSQFGRETPTFAFHGSKLEAFHSILNFGLAQHLCKRDLYGDGTYLSTSMDVAMNFSSKGSAWPNSHLLGDHLSCVALCEYVPNPMHIRNDPKKIPKSYIVLTNNEIVRVRYVLVFTRPRRRPRNGATTVQQSVNWSTGAKITVGVVFYLCLLGLVGIYNRSQFGRDSGSIWSLWK